MASILDRYGIKEVADVTFYEIDPDTKEISNPVLVLDSLKVTSIEQTAETAEARGGKGNAKLIVWDYGKELTVNIEDALFSPKSLAIMMGTGEVSTVTDDSAETIERTARLVVGKDKKFPKAKIDGKETNSSVRYFDANGKEILNESELSVGDVIHAKWEQAILKGSKQLITIKPDSFPGTYYVTGDTMIRNQATGKDEYFQFIIKKAKMKAEQTIQMQADGDPSTFNMSLEILRPDDGEMVQFIKYKFDETGFKKDPDTTKANPDNG